MTKLTEAKKQKLIEKFKKRFPKCWFKDGAEFSGNGQAILWSGEGSEINDAYAFDPWSQNYGLYECGVHKELADFSEENGLYWEAVDNGTFLAYEI